VVDGGAGEVEAGGRGLNVQEAEEKKSVEGAEGKGVSVVVGDDKERGGDESSMIDARGLSGKDLERAIRGTWWQRVAWKLRQWLSRP
jgi:hypothetical protein